MSIGPHVRTDFGYPDPFCDLYPLDHGDFAVIIDTTNGEHTMNDQMNKSEIDAGTLRRAKKIFALANNNPSAEEAASAMAQVEKVMAKYGLTYDDLKDDTVQKQFGETYTGKKQKSAFPNWYRWLAGAVANITETRAVRYEAHKEYTMRFQGINGDDQVAAMMMEYLVDTMNRCLKAYKKEHGLKGTAIALDFRRGFALEIANRAYEIKNEREAQRKQEQEAANNGEPGQSLAVIKLDLISNHFTGVTMSRRKQPKVRLSDDGAYSAGREAGSRTSLNKQVGGSSQRRIA